MRARRPRPGQEGHLGGAGSTKSDVDGRRSRDRDDVEAEPDGDIEVEEAEIDLRISRSTTTSRRGRGRRRRRAAAKPAAKVKVAAPATDDDEIAEPSEKDKASGDFVWDEEESEALRQARKDAELTASADSVRAYLKQIGKVALLNAEEEVELAKRIEAGLYATQLMAEKARTGEKYSPHSAATCRGSAATVTARKTICWRRICVWWCRWPSATRAAAWRSWTSSRRATSA